MILVDANVLLYASNSSMPPHEAARSWLEAALNGDEPVGFAWVVLLAFLRVSTMPALLPDPLSAEDAFGLVDDWVGAHAATMVHPTTRHAGVLRGLLVEAGTAGNVVSDAHLAALAAEHGARICTFDRDFERFSGVKSFSPASPR